VCAADVYVDPDVAAVQDLWVRSGAAAAPAIAEQLAAFAGALRVARERARLTVPASTGRCRRAPRR